MRIFFSVGEPSGDLHGANLIRELTALRPDVEAVGYGGPRMAAAGCVLHEDLTQWAVMWITRVLLNLHVFLGLLSRADRYFRQHRPDAVVLIDYPGFNWWIARRAKAHGIPVFYYSPPQVWAWARWRVAKMRRFVDHVLCGLPFEAQWYREQNCPAEFIGHPYFDELRERRLDAEFMTTQQAKPGRLVTLLPGSRTQEVTQNLPSMLAAARLIQKRLGDVRFAIAAFKGHQAEFARERVAESGLDIEVHLGRTAELIELATCCLAVSGSVSLELLYHLKPTVIVYRTTKFGLWLQRQLRKTRYITLVNLLASDEAFVPRATDEVTQAAAQDDVLFPEHLTVADPAAAVAGQLTHWLIDEAARQQRVEQLDALRSQVSQGGASRAAAQRIVAVVEERRPCAPRPHYYPSLRVESSCGADVEYERQTAPLRPSVLD